ncbi:hypothetical protein JCM8547_002828 [Rhodosporidiobolus lusitaniae]
MLFRLASFVSLASVALLMLGTGSVDAAMAQGAVDLSRDHAVQYDTSVFASTEAFCKKLRSACVDYVGPIGTYGSHHQLDCRFTLDDGTPIQTGSRPYAFCGGLAKNPDGTWTNGGAITDYTKEVIKKYFSKSVTVKGGPVDLKTCKRYIQQPKYKAIEATCSSASQ